MKRRPLQLSLVLGLLLILIACIAFVRGFRAMEVHWVRFEWNPTPHEHAYVAVGLSTSHEACGIVGEYRSYRSERPEGVARADGFVTGRDARSRRKFQVLANVTGSRLRRMRFSLALNRHFRMANTEAREAWVGAPTWFLVLAGAALIACPCVALHRARRSRLRHAVGEPCGKCGYDLRGGPHERCPECGETAEIAPRQ